MVKKRIVVICGTGIATSTVVAKKTEDLCRANSIPVEIIQGRAVEANQLSENADMVITTTPSLRLRRDVPIINGIPFLNGIGEETLREDILKAIGHK